MFPDQPLLRDALYLLQGIDGKHVRFALRPPKEQNPYLTENGRNGDGVGFPLGKNSQAEDQGEEGDVVGIDIVVNEDKAGCRSSYGNLSN
jgi:gamma-tubulin complex component 3